MNMNLGVKWKTDDLIQIQMASKIQKETITTTIKDKQIGLGP